MRGAERVATWAGDLADAGRHPDLLAALAADLGTPDVALLAWGTLTDQGRAEADPAYAAAELTTNFAAPAALLLALAGRVAAPGGVIACVTSVAGDRGRQSNAAYGAAKGGLQRLLEGLRHRLHGRGIAVLDVRPGFVATPHDRPPAPRGPLVVHARGGRAGRPARGRAQARRALHALVLALDHARRAGRAPLPPPPHPPLRPCPPAALFAQRTAGGQ